MAGYDIEQKPGESLERYYRRLAKTADQRLVRLESYSNDQYYKTAKEWAYSRAVKDIKKWLKPGAPEPEKLRFNTAPPQKTEDLVAKINDIKTFISSPTSTKKGITEVYKKRADTFNRKYGTKFTWQQLAKYYTSGQAELWEEKFGSKTALRTIGQIQKKGKKIISEIAKADAKDIRVEADNKVLTRTVNKALKDNELNIEDLF